MTKKPITNVPASIRQKLLNLSRESHRTFDELLQYFAMERFLYRLSISEFVARFCLKGALMFRVWEAPQSRATRDIDFRGEIKNETGELVRILRDICNVVVDPDGLNFDDSKISAEQIIIDAEYTGLRANVPGKLGKARFRIQIDVGFGDVVWPQNKKGKIKYPTILGMPPPILYGYSRETAIAEKFEAMTKLGIANSRMKDFFDIWHLSRQFDFDGKNLAEAIKMTFDNRKTEIQAGPTALSRQFGSDTAKQTQWAAFVRKSKLDIAPKDLKSVISVLNDFLGPITKSLSDNKLFRGKWKAPGSWEI